MNPEGENKTDERYAELLKLANSRPVELDDGFYERLREESGREFLAQFAASKPATSPQGQEQEPTPKLCRRRSPMAIFLIRALATAATIAVAAVSFWALSPDETPAALDAAIRQVTQANTVQLDVTLGDSTATVRTRGTERIRWDYGDGRYDIAAGKQLWKVDERENRATPSPFAMARVFAAGLDLFCLLELPDYKPGTAEKTYRTARPIEVEGQQDVQCYRMDLADSAEKIELEAFVEKKTQKLRSLSAVALRDGKREPLGRIKVVATNKEVPEELFVIGDMLTRDGRIGKVTDHQGIASLRPAMHSRWTPVAGRVLLRLGDWLRTDVRGANAVRCRLAPETDVVLGPGSLVELIQPDRLRIASGEIKVTASEKTPVELMGPGDAKVVVKAAGHFRLADGKLLAVESPPLWLQGFEGATTQESLGSLIAKVDGRNVPLTVGYHKVTVDIRDQIARTVIEESFVNRTSNTEPLEGIFYFPLPQDASISGFAMWVGNELVEADVVEKQRAREIFEVLRHEKRDPGLLEWMGGNIFQARVYPIPPNSEKRIKITYTQVLPLRGNQFRYSYALQSELLRQHPLRELAMAVTIHSATPLADVQSPTHTTRIAKSKQSAQVEFSAQEYTPTSDFEVVVELAEKRPNVVVLPHRRGEDGYFMLQLTPPVGDTTGHRDVLPDGEPMELLILADTSASMDRDSRRNQAEFIAAVLGSLTPGDRVNLATCDVECSWAFERPVAVSPENVAAAREFLAGCRSLGWSNLDAAFASALAQAGPNAQVIYVGDGIVSGKDSDPVAFGNRLRRLWQGKTAACHAVAVSSSFEPTVLREIALLGGGSVRQISGTSGPAALAGELLAEITGPTARDLKVEFRGLQVAAVYPEILPNLAAGAQQILLGRYLPEGRDQTGEVTVSGRKGERTLSYTTGVTLADAESGNSFIPRLWARMHLDHLLAQGASQAIRDEIIALSEQYHIITPYTSLLVLETDADRERFKVKRRFGMRAGERFFGKGRDEAYYELVSQQMRRAGNWRIGLRRNVLAELAGLGRGTRQPEGEWRERYRFSVGIGRETTSLQMMVSPSMVIEEEFFAGGLTEMAFDYAPTAGTLGVGVEGVSFQSAAAADRTSLLTPIVGAPLVAFAPATGEPRADFLSGGKMLFGKASARKYPGYTPWSGYTRWLDELFLRLPPAPTTQEPKRPWPAEARKLAESLLRSDILTQGEAALSIVVRTERYDVLYDELASVSESFALVSTKDWLTRTGGNGSQTIAHWCNEKERGVLSKAFQLGRLRQSQPEDLARPPLGLFGYVLGSLEKDHQGFSVSVEPKDEERTLLVLTDPNDQDRKVHVLIDTKREVILRIEHRHRDKISLASVADEFVEVNGAWLAGRITTTDSESRRTTVVTQRFEPLAPEAFAKQLASELAGRERVQFIHDPLPKRGEAKQAIAEGKATVDDHLVRVLHFCNTQQWRHAWRQFDQAQKLAADKPGFRWVRDSLLHVSRRREELKNRILAEAARLAETPAASEDRSEDFFLADHLYGRAREICEANEMLDLLDVLEPVYRRQEPLVEAPKRWNQRRLEHLHQAGQTEQVFALRKQLAVEYPRDHSLQIQYANALARRGEIESALAWIRRVTAGDTKWHREQEESLRDTYTHFLWDRGRYAELVDYLADWIKTNPEIAWPYERYVGTLVRIEQAEEANRLVTAWAEEGRQPGELEPAVAARLDAAVTCALGDGWNGSGRIGDRWRDLLYGTVRYFAEHEFHAGVAERIMGHRRFRGIDEHQRIRKETLAKLLAEVDKLPVDQLRRFADWIWTDRSTIEPETWKRLTVGLEKRWAAETDPKERHEIGAVLLRLLHHRPFEERLAFLRRRLEEGPNEYRASYAGELWSTLLAQSWNAEYEREAFSLIEKLSDADDPDERLRHHVDKVRELTDKMVAGRFKKLMGEVKEQHKLSRTQLQEVRQKNQDLARCRYADQLAEQMRSRPAELARWMNIERLYLDTLAQRDLGKVEQECWEYLGPKPRAEQPDEGAKAALQIAFQDRCVMTLLNLAARRSAKPELAERLLKYFDAGIAQDEKAARWKLMKYRLLVALDRPEDLEKALLDWIRIDDADGHWRRTLGYLLGEQGKIDEAIEQFERVERADELGPDEYRSLADWYMVANRRKQYEEARIAVYQAQDERSLSRWAHRQLSILDGRVNNVPPDLSPDAPLAFALLFEKSGSPGQHAGRLHELYQRTHDFRLLEGLPESVLGHTSGRVYPFLKNLRHVVGEIRKEAVVDQITERIGEARKWARCAVDHRALDLLEAKVERRAAELLDQPGPHARRAVDALKRACQREWTRGEPRLMADYLASLGAISQPELAKEQRHQVRLLHEQAGRGSIDRLHIARQRARITWDYSRRQEAIDLLSAALQEYQDAVGGVLPVTAREPLSVLAEYLERQSHFAQAESLLQRQLAKPVNQQQTRWLTERLYQTYEEALSRGGQVSLGSGETLYKAVEKAIREDLKTDDDNHRFLLVRQLTRFYRTAHEKNVGTARDDLMTFASKQVPQLIERHTNHYSDVIRNVAYTIDDLRGPLDGMTFLIERCENEPQWFAKSEDSSWDHFYDLLTRWRPEAKELGDLEDRLLRIVLAALRRDLENNRFRKHNHRNRSLPYWCRDTKKREELFWKEKAPEFAKAAEEVLASQRDSAEAVLSIAAYFWDGLVHNDRAIEILFDAHRRKMLDDRKQCVLVDYLHARKRYGESIAMLESLVERNPNNSGMFVRLMRAYYHTKQQNTLVEMVEKRAISDLRANEWDWREIGRLAGTCVETELYVQALDYYEELIPLYKRDHGHEGRNDSTLSGYFCSQANAYAGLKKTREAVSAACDAIVCWGPSQSQREHTLDTLQSVLSQSPNLDAYVTWLDKDVEEKKTEVPIVRKALGKVYAEKQQYDKAITQLKLALAVQLLDTETHRVIVDCYDKQNDAQGAIRQLFESFHVSRRDIKLYEDLGDRFAKLEQPKQAERAYTSIVEMRNNESAGHEALAKVRQRQDRWTDAVDHWKLVDRIRSKEPAGLLGLAEAQIHLKQWDEASDTVARLLQGPWPNRFGNVHGKAHELKKKIEEGRRK